MHIKTHLFIKTILLSLLLALSHPALADDNGNDTIPPTTIDPSDGKIDIPIKNIKFERSLIEPINAYYYIGEYTIEMEFNENVGTEIGNNSSVIVTPTTQNKKFTVTAYTNEGYIATESIELESTNGIKSIIPTVDVENYIDVELHCVTTSPNSFYYCKLCNTKYNGIE